VVVFYLDSHVLGKGIEPLVARFSTLCLHFRAKLQKKIYIAKWTLQKSTYWHTFFFFALMVGCN